MSTSLRIAIATLAMSCTLALTSAGRAQQEDDNKIAASETFRAATAAYQRGDFEAAARSFEVSHRLLPHPNTMYNAGRAWQEAGRLARAADALTIAVAMDEMSAEQRADADARLAELRPRLAIVHILAPAGTTVTLAHAENKKTPVSIHVLPGQHTIVAKYADGRAGERRIDSLAAGAEVEVELAPAAGGQAIEPGPKPDPAPPDPVPDELPTERNQAQWISGWVILGVGVVSGGAAIGLGVAALSARDDFEASGNTDADARDRAATLRTSTNVMWAVAGSFTLTGALLLVFSEQEVATQAHNVRIDVGAGSVTLSGAW